MKHLITLLLFLQLFGCFQERKSSLPLTSDETLVQVEEKHRPYFHFSPDSMWMNDPNGLVFNNGTYHMFYQYYPDSTVWGPMHWGHAVSTDMIRWEDLPIALYPDEHGYIFSGSAVVDVENTSGLGTNDNSPIVAIYTYHDPVGASEGRIDYQTQGIAYSNDGGESWEKYKNNPVLKNPGIRDFRDPNVRWFEPEQKWIMTLAVKDHIRFYSSPNLKNWKLESEFGKDIGAHGGVWECPDLFPLKLNDTDQTYWILIVSLNPGGPNGGSGTQYFMGQFDGKRFSPIDTTIRWLDYGPDNYAGVTWSNTGDRTLFIGWMSNWKYANVVPTERWRSAMTIARELTLGSVADEMFVHSTPVREFHNYTSTVFEAENLDIDEIYSVTDQANLRTAKFVLSLTFDQTQDFSIILQNNVSNHVELRFNKDKNLFLIDRSQSGDTSFHDEFGDLIVAQRHSKASNLKLTMVADVASMEVFADDGATAFTAIYFPDEELDMLTIKSDDALSVKKLTLSEIKL